MTEEQLEKVKPIDPEVGDVLDDESRKEPPIWNDFGLKVKYLYYK